MSRLICTALVAVVTVVSACSRQEEKIPDPGFSGFRKPDHFPAPVYDFKNNPVTKDGFELGRKLFYDTRLSVDNTVSCGSCHAQIHGFADHGTALSKGISGLRGRRNAPAMSNLAWYSSFMWDGGINHLEVMPIAPITNPVEMGHDLKMLISALNDDSEYRNAFKRAFGTEEITDQKLLFALSQFMSMMISADSKYDKVVRGFEKFSVSEERGRNLFLANCSSCHKEPLFTDFSFRSNGLDQVSKDSGRAMITGVSDDLGKFKVPSLRNVMITYPYMHDGRFFTMKGVLDHYSSGVQHSASLDPLLETGIKMTEEQKRDLISFLHTLTDHTFLTDPQFSEPR